MNSKNTEVAFKKLSLSPLKVTEQRKNLINILFKEGNAHYTAEQIHKKVIEKGLKISLATVYNSLNQFTKYGILKEIKVNPDKMYFDTNYEPHHHFYYKDIGKLEDIDHNKIKIKSLPSVPKGNKLESVEVLITLKS